MLLVAEKEKTETRENTEKCCCDLLNRRLNLINKNTIREQIVEVNGNESGSSRGSDSACSCENCTTECDCADCAHNNDNMEFNDEPESDNEYADESDEGDEDDWRDVEYGAESDDLDLGSGRSRESSHNGDFSDGLELMDAFSDISDDHGRELTIALDVDSSSSSSLSVEHMVGSSSCDEGDLEVYEGEYHDDEEVEEDEEEAEEHDDDFDDAEVSDGYTVEYSNSDPMDNSSSQSSSDSEYSDRSRSPVLRAPRPRIPERQNSGNPTVQPESSSTAQPQPKPETSSKDEPDVRPSASTAEDQDDGTCCICLDDVSTHVVVPCGHICLCQTCTNLLTSNDNHRRRKKCPLCKTAFTMVIKVYK